MPLVLLNPACNVKIQAKSMLPELPIDLLQCASKCVLAQEKAVENLNT